MGQAVSSVVVCTGFAVIMAALAWVLFARLHKLERKVCILETTMRDQHATIDDVYDIVGMDVDSIADVCDADE